MECLSEHLFPRLEEGRRPFLDPLLSSRHAHLRSTARGRIPTGRAKRTGPGAGRNGYGAFSERGGPMACDRCAAEPDADLTRYVAYEGDQELLSLVMCPGCSYGFNTLLRAYVANRELSITR